MKTVGIIVFLACLIRLSRQSDYKAVVVEYSPLMTTGENIVKYSNIVDIAAEIYKFDIIVFPEESLTMKVEDASLVPHPDEMVVPYKNKTYAAYAPIRVMSETAARNKVYLVVNLFERFECKKDGDCPSRGYFLYNTNVAFDRDGTVIARYRKFNLFSKNVDKPKVAELSTFTTDFNVTFGMIICFDILFKSPSIDLVRQKNIRNIIFSTWWFGELPFLTAVQMQTGWAYAMDVNLLASGMNIPSQGSTGSGIYSRRSKKAYMVEKDMDILIMKEFSQIVGTGKETRGLLLKENPSVRRATWKDLDLSAGAFEEELRHGNIMCHFKIRYAQSYAKNDRNYTYRAVAFSDVRDFGQGEYHREAFCGVLLCSNGNCARKPASGNYPIVFESMAINGIFEEENTFQMPSTLVWTGDKSEISLLDTLEYEYYSFYINPTAHKKYIRASMILKKGGVDNLVTFAIYGREFDS